MHGMPLFLKSRFCEELTLSVASDSLNMIGKTDIWTIDLTPETN